MTSFTLSLNGVGITDRRTIDFVLRPGEQITNPSATRPLILRMTHHQNWNWFEVELGPKGIYTAVDYVALLSAHRPGQLVGDEGLVGH